MHKHGPNALVKLLYQAKVSTICPLGASGTYKSTFFFDFFPMGKMSKTILTLFFRREDVKLTGNRQNDSKSTPQGGSIETRIRSNRPQESLLVSVSKDHI